MVSSRTLYTPHATILRRRYWPAPTPISPAQAVSAHSTYRCHYFLTVSWAVSWMLRSALLTPSFCDVRPLQSHFTIPSKVQPCRPGHSQLSAPRHPYYRRATSCRFQLHYKNPVPYRRQRLATRAPLVHPPYEASCARAAHHRRWSCIEKTHCAHAHHAVVHDCPRNARV